MVSGKIPYTQIPQQKCLKPVLYLQLKTEKKKYKMLLSRLKIVIFTSLLLFSCTAKVDKPERTGTIPENDFETILTEIQVADGLLANPRIQNWVLSIDSLSTYHYIAQKHGYSKEIFDRTINYYFIRKPKKLIKIYDRILAKLSEMESRLDKEAMLEREHSSNVWPGEKNYYFPDIHSVASTDFRLTLVGNKPYNLRFTATVFPDDQSVNPRVGITAVAADSLQNGKKYFFQSPVFIKDGNPHQYNVSIFVATPGAIQINGSLNESCSFTEEWQKHIYFEGITLGIPASEI